MCSSPEDFCECHFHFCHLWGRSLENSVVSLGKSAGFLVGSPRRNLAFSNPGPFPFCSKAPCAVCGGQNSGLGGPPGSSGPERERKGPRFEKDSFHLSDTRRVRWYPPPERMSRRLEGEGALLGSVLNKKQGY
jgi:hypothetical protein